MRGQYYYLFLNLFSRKVVGWQVYEAENSALVREVLRDLYQREGLRPQQVVLHSDNGSPMKGATMLANAGGNPFAMANVRVVKALPIVGLHVAIED